MEDAFEKITSIRQEGTVYDYCVEFEFLFNKVEISEGYAIYLFIDGLEQEIRDVFVTWHQYSFHTLKDNISLALRLDANMLQDSFSSFDPKSSLYKKDLVFDFRKNLDEIVENNEFTKGVKILDNKNVKAVEGMQRSRDESQESTDESGNTDKIQENIVASYNTNMNHWEFDEVGIVNKWPTMVHKDKLDIRANKTHERDVQKRNLVMSLESDLDDENEFCFDQVRWLDEMYTWHKWKSKLDSSAKLFPFTLHELKRVDNNNGKCVRKKVHHFLNIGITRNSDFLKNVAASLNNWDSIEDFKHDGNSFLEADEFNNDFMTKNYIEEFKNELLFKFKNKEKGGLQLYSLEAIEWKLATVVLYPDDPLVNRVIRTKSGAKTSKKFEYKSIQKQQDSCSSYLHSMRVQAMASKIVTAWIKTNTIWWLSFELIAARNFVWKPGWQHFWKIWMIGAFFGSTDAYWVLIVKWEGDLFKKMATKHRWHIWKFKMLFLIVIMHGGLFILTKDVLLIFDDGIPILQFMSSSLVARTSPQSTESG